MLRPILLFLGAFGLAAGCSKAKAPAEDAGTFAPPRDLTAILVDGQHIDLTWKYEATAPGGAFVEFKMGAEDERFTLLDAAWPGTAVFRHPDVAPDTRFIYRVRSFFGRPSEVVQIETGSKGPSDADQVEGPLDGSDGMVAYGESTNKRPAFAPETAPSHFTARLSSGTSVELRWRDRAVDEDGYLVEISPVRDGDYRIAALLRHDSSSFRKISLAEKTRYFFRVRAFYFGQSSNLATVLTPSATVQRNMKKMIEEPGNP
jgi:hypothetical protein